MTLLHDTGSPDVAVQGGVACKAYVHCGGQRGETVFNLAIECGETFDGVARPVRVDAEDIAIGGGSCLNSDVLKVGK